MIWTTFIQTFSYPPTPSLLRKCGQMMLSGAIWDWPSLKQIWTNVVQIHNRNNFSSNSFISISFWGNVGRWCSLLKSGVEWVYLDSRGSIRVEREAKEMYWLLILNHLYLYKSYLIHFKTYEICWWKLKGTMYHMLIQQVKVLHSWIHKILMYRNEDIIMT
jgi:hypothetical protein